MSGAAETVTAGLLVIGDEILSGRTKDQNIGYIADYLAALGIDLCEVRIVGDEEARIVEAVDAMRRRYTYLFTTGGIGPTHDDITAEAVAKAVGAELRVDQRAVAMMRERYPVGELNAARMRMARIPAGAELVANPVTKAPGFWVENVIVMAGVPSIMQGMLDAVGPRLEQGARMLSAAIVAGLKEGDVAAELSELAARFPDVLVGSYPHFDGSAFTTTIVARSRSAERVTEAEAAIRAMVETIKAKAAASS